MTAKITQCMHITGLVLVLAAASAAAQPSGLTLREGTVTGTLTFESDASTGNFGDTASVAPDLAVGVSDDVTLAVIHSTFGRTGFRGSAGAGVCTTDTCTNTYDNAGIEGLYAVRRGTLAIAANAGFHAWSFDRDHYVVKLGAKLRYMVGKLALASLPAVTIAVSGRDGMMPNRDRIWIPLSATYPIIGGFAVGAATGFKGPINNLDDGYEIATGALAQYTYQPGMVLGASWVHGKMLGGSMALPDDAHGYDSRAVHVWLTATH